MATFSQTQISTIKQNRDMNGAPLRNMSVQTDSPNSISCVMTTYTYDSIRALTEINDPYWADAYPWISADGLRLYYTSQANDNQLMFTQRPNTNSNFVTPTIVPISVLFSFSYWISLNELDVYVCNGNKLYYTHRNTISSPFNAPVSISLLGTSWSFISGASLNALQNELFLYSANIGIIEFSRSSDTSFTYTRTLPTPTGYQILPGQLSKDELTFFFGARYNLGKTLLFQMTRASSTDSFDISTFEQIQGINDNSVHNFQPSMSDNLEWVAFGRNPDNTWTGDDLFIAHKKTISTIISPVEKQIFSFGYPNPAFEDFSISYNTTSNTPITLSIYSSEGKFIYEEVINPSNESIKIGTRTMKDGQYFYRLSQFTNQSTRFWTGKFVVIH